MSDPRLVTNRFLLIEQFWTDPNFQSPIGGVVLVAVDVAVVWNHEVTTCSESSSIRMRTETRSK
jgi:hypothetical protein